MPRRECVLTGVTLRYLGETGVGIVATDPLAIGTVVLQERPYATSLLPTAVPETCRACFATISAATKGLQTCRWCHAVHYCSFKCASLDRLAHRVSGECWLVAHWGVLSRVAPLGLRLEALLALRHLAAQAGAGQLSLRSQPQLQPQDEQPPPEPPQQQPQDGLQQERGPHGQDAPPQHQQQLQRQDTSEQQGVGQQGPPSEPSPAAQRGQQTGPPSSPLFFHPGHLGPSSELERELVDWQGVTALRPAGAAAPEQAQGQAPEQEQEDFFEAALAAAAGVGPGLGLLATLLARASRAGDAALRARQRAADRRQVRREQRQQLRREHNEQQQRQQRQQRQLDHAVTQQPGSADSKQPELPGGSEAADAEEQTLLPPPPLPPPPRRHASTPPCRSSSSSGSSSEDEEGGEAEGGGDWLRDTLGSPGGPGGAAAYWRRSAQASAQHGAAGGRGGVVGAAGDNDCDDDQEPETCVEPRAAVLLQWLSSAWRQRPPLSGGGAAAADVVPCGGGVTAADGMAEAEAGEDEGSMMAAAAAAAVEAAAAVAAAARAFSCVLVNAMEVTLHPPFAAGLIGAGRAPALAAGPHCTPLALYRYGCRINHSCRPTAATHFRPTGQLLVRLVTDVSCGGEVTLSYVDTALPRCHRRDQLLAKYGFHCACVRCGEGSSKDAGSAVAAVEDSSTGVGAISVKPLSSARHAASADELLAAAGDPWVEAVRQQGSASVAVDAPSVRLEVEAGEHVVRSTASRGESKVKDEEDAVTEAGERQGVQERLQRLVLGCGELLLGRQAAAEDVYGALVQGLDRLLTEAKAKAAGLGEMAGVGGSGKAPRAAFAPQHAACLDAYALMASAARRCARALTGLREAGEDERTARQEQRSDCRSQASVVWWCRAVCASIAGAAAAERLLAADPALLQHAAAAWSEAASTACEFLSALFAAAAPSAVAETTMPAAPQQRPQQLQWPLKHEEAREAVTAVLTAEQRRLAAFSLLQLPQRQPTGGREPLGQGQGRAQGRRERRAVEEWGRAEPAGKRQRRALNGPEKEREREAERGREEERRECYRSDEDPDRQRLKRLDSSQVRDWNRTSEVDGRRERGVREEGRSPGRHQECRWESDSAGGRDSRQQGERPRRSNVSYLGWGQQPSDTDPWDRHRTRSRDQDAAWSPARDWGPDSCRDVDTDRSRCQQDGDVDRGRSTRGSSREYRVSEPHRSSRNGGSRESAARNDGRVNGGGSGRAHRCRADDALPGPPGCRSRSRSPHRYPSRDRAAPGDDADRGRCRPWREARSPVDRGRWECYSGEARRSGGAGRTSEGWRPGSHDRNRGRSRDRERVSSPGRRDRSTVNGRGLDTAYGNGQQRRQGPGSSGGSGAKQVAAVAAAAVTAAGPLLAGLCSLPHGHRRVFTAPVCMLEPCKRLFEAGAALASWSDADPSLLAPIQERGQLQAQGVSEIALRAMQDWAAVVAGPMAPTATTTAPEATPAQAGCVAGNSAGGAVKAKSQGLPQDSIADRARARAVAGLAASALAHALARVHLLLRVLLGEAHGACEACQFLPFFAEHLPYELAAEVTQVATSLLMRVHMPHVGLIV